MTSRCRTVSLQDADADRCQLVISSVIFCKSRGFLKEAGVYFLPCSFGLKLKFPSFFQEVEPDGSEVNETCPLAMTCPSDNDLSIDAHCGVGMITAQRVCARFEAR